MSPLDKNKTGDIVKKPQNHKLMGCKWILKKKKIIPRVGTMRYKARLLAKGFTERDRVDFNEIISILVK